MLNRCSEFIAKDFGGHHALLHFYDQDCPCLGALERMEDIVV